MTAALSPDLLKGHVHIVGIGGAGMSAIARVLLGRGTHVSGSDRAASAVTASLEAAGAVFHEGHDPAHVRGADVVLITSAARDDNPEVFAARAAGIPVLKRRELLPLLMGDSLQICVAGTHGKTTTTALIVHILRMAGRDPSYIVGGVMQNTGDNARAGSGDAFVIEADEYDHMFLGLRPTIAVLTNIEHDHPDMFPTLDDTLSAFRAFIAQIPEYDGVLIACADDPQAAALARARRASGQPTLLYSIHDPAVDWPAVPIPDGFTIRGMVDGEKVEVDVRAQLPPALVGDHNLQNLLGAVAAAVAYGVPLGDALTALGTFQGTGRRMETIGTFNGARLISDYGHHPTAIRATLQAARQLYPGKRLWAVWQPHTYSRTRTLADEFARAFAGADHALVTDIYAARETPFSGDPDGPHMARLIAATGHPDARPGGTLEATAALLRNALGGDDVCLIFSAGDAPRIAALLMAGR